MSYGELCMVLFDQIRLQVYSVFHYDIYKMHIVSDSNCFYYSLKNSQIHSMPSYAAKFLMESIIVW